MNKNCLLVVFLLLLIPLSEASPMPPRACSSALGTVDDSSSPDADASTVEASSAFTLLATDATYGCRRPHGYGAYDPKVNKTFVCWNGPGMSVMGSYYDHATREWAPVREIFHQDSYGTWDYHNYPNMILAPDGHLLITWADHSENLKLVRSSAPHSMEGEWEYQLIEEEENCYPMIMAVGERVYIFYSQTKDINWPYRPFGYIYSDDSGRTWSEHTPAIDSQQLDPDRIDEVYAYHYAVQPGDAESPARIHFVWVMRGGPHGHNQGSRNVYFASFIPEDGTWESADGVNLGDVIDLDDMLKHCVVFDSGAMLNERLVNRVMCSYYNDGTPFVVYNKNRENWSARWEDGAWRNERLEGLDARDLERMPDGSHRMLLADGNQAAMAIAEQQEKGDEWVKVFERAIPYREGADRTWSMAFIDQSRPEVDILMSQLKIGEQKEDYSGRWPVWTVDTSIADEVDAKAK